MPAKKKSRAASRTKPVLSNITNKLTAAQAQERQKKKDLIVEDFKKNVQLRIEWLRAEQQQLEKSIQRAYSNYRQELLPWHNVTVEQLLKCDEENSKGKKGAPKPTPQASKRRLQQDEGPTTEVAEAIAHPVSDLAAADRLAADFTKDSQNTATVITQVVPDTTHSQDSNAESAETTEAGTPQDDVTGAEEVSEEAAPAVSCLKPPRESGITALLEATSQFSSKVKRGKAAGGGAAPNTATRSSSRARRPPCAPTGMLAPPSTARMPRNRKVLDSAALVTPAGRAPVSVASLLVTPKFDPRLPLPPGTVRRRALPNEIPMSITGSPLKVSPAKPALKAIMNSFLNTVKREMPAGQAVELSQLHLALDRFIDNRRSNP